MSATPPLLILGGGANALSAARSVGARGVPVGFLSDGRGNLDVARSRYVRSGLALRPGDDWEAQWCDLLTAPTTRRGVLLPGSDEGLDFLARHGEAMRAVGHRPIELSAAAVTLMLDKARAYAFAAERGIPAPRTRRVASPAEARTAVDELGLPCAFKPRISHRYTRTAATAHKALVVDVSDDIADAFRRVAGPGGDLLVTEIVPGADDAYCSYYTFLDPAGEPLVHFTKRKPRQMPPHFGSGSFHETRWLPDVAEQGLRVLQAAGVRGIGNIEFKRDARDGTLRFIECNLRLTAADGLVRRAGLDLAWLAYRRATGDDAQPVAAELTPTPPFREGLRQVVPTRDLRAAAAYLREGELDLTAFVRSWRPPLGPPVFAVADPAPAVAGAVRRVGRLRGGGS